MIQRVEEYVLIPKPTFYKEKIQEVVETSLQGFSMEAAEKEVSINLETRALESEGDLFIDKDLLSKALFFILENSIEASVQVPMGKKGRVVKVSLFEDEENIGISISDKGEGIPQKNINQIFTPFFSTRPDRVGLGLTMAKRMVEEQEGRIQVKSRLKRGTTIILIFPKDRRRMVRRKKLSPKDAGKVMD